jgi:predicted outer membrane repeat protein
LGANGNANHPGLDTIRFSDSLIEGVLLLTEGPLGISQPLKIVGPNNRQIISGVFPGNDLFILQGSDAENGIFYFGNLILTGGRSAIVSSDLFGDDITIENCLISGNGFNFSLPAINASLSISSSITIIDSTISNNHGGGVRGNNVVIERSFIANNNGRGVSATNVDVFDSTISGNNMTGNGGGIYADNVTLTRTNVSNNSSTGTGGGISASTVTINQSVVSGNNSTGRGGGIYAQGTLTLTESTVSNNLASLGSGGGIRATGPVTLIQSTVSGNRTMGVNADGGGIFSSAYVSLNQSTISGNSTAGIDAEGGGIFAAQNVTLTQSTVSGNSTTGNGAQGGGIFATNVTLTQSTVSGNETAGAASRGGGIYANNTVALTQSTVSANRTIGTNADGGGIRVNGNLTLTQSTVYSNHSALGLGGGIWSNNGQKNISGSIVAGNTAGGGNADLRLPLGSPSLTVNYSLIGTGVVPNAGGNNISSDTPLLGQLADNGGPTPTHALLPGSLAIDASNSALMTDQRGRSVPADLAGIPNAAGGNGSDIGAYEAQVAPSADFDGDGDVDGRDFLAWQRGFGTSNAVKADGNSDDDQDVDDSDLSVWQIQYGEEEELSAVSSQLSASENDALPFLAAPVNQSARGYLETENHIDALYVEEVDRALEQWNASTTLLGKFAPANPQGGPAVAPFGEMVARRGIKRLAVK